MLYQSSSGTVLRAVWHVLPTTLLHVYSSSVGIQLHYCILGILACTNTAFCGGISLCIIHEPASQVKFDTAVVPCIAGSKYTRYMYYNVIRDHSNWTHMIH